MTINNMGKGEIPSGSSRPYQGKYIQCMCAWSQEGSMSTKIIKDSTTTLDTLDIFDHPNGINPALLLEGHSSCIGLPFLQYTNDKHISGQSSMVSHMEPVCGKRRVVSNIIKRT